MNKTAQNTHVILGNPSYL